MGLASYFEKKGDAGIVIFAGKGGLGKTTCSAGLSHYMASKRARKVLCFSTDPQASRCATSCEYRLPTIPFRITASNGNSGMSLMS